MKACVLMLIIVVATSGLAFGNSIGLFADTSAISCWIYDTGSALLPIYAVAIVPSGALGVEFSAPQPACMVGVTYLSDGQMFPGTLGNSQNDVIVDFGGTCYATPVPVLTINYFGTGQSTTCCEYSVLAGANDPSGPSYEDCSNMFLHALTGGIITVNPDGTCLCIVPTHNSTWGQIKSLYQ